MSSPSPQLPLGQVIGSRYRVQSLIGRGGMGMVYAATHELTGRRVALKLMINEVDEAPILQERFLSEARIAAAVRHPNIVDVLDMGLHGGSPFIVMELLEGVSLERVLESQQRLSVEQALSWLLPIIGALSVLHEAGIVHRDVKPSNIFMSSLPRHPMRPKLLDFGLARVVSDLRLTRSGTVIGTPLYMAPEHAAGQVTGPQADVWSIGVVIFESLAGCSPFNYTDRQSLAMQVIAGLVRPLAQVRPDIPPLISSAIGRALQRDLTRRYPDMRSFAQALHAAARASNIPVPLDPDPIGLPEYAQWQSGELPVGTTHEHFPRADAGSGSGSSRVPSSPFTPAAGSAESVLSDSTFRMTGAKTSRRWLGLGLLALVIAAAIFALSRRGSAPAPIVQPSPGPAGTGSVGANREPEPVVQPNPAAPGQPANESKTTDGKVVPSQPAPGQADQGAASPPSVRGTSSVTLPTGGRRRPVERTPGTAVERSGTPSDRAANGRAAKVNSVDTERRSTSVSSTASGGAAGSSVTGSGTRRTDRDGRAGAQRSPQTEEEVESEWK